ncbi:MAG: hypothetical protein R3F24_04400 [Gammaproteobacteria bacterium]
MFDTTTGRVGLKYTLDEWLDDYGSIAYGEGPMASACHRPYPSSTAVRPGEIVLVNAFDPEKITAYEIGIKGFTPDRHTSASTWPCSSTTGATSCYVS